MRIAYYDESGDDGYPSYSSPLFVLTSLYLHYLNWKSTYEKIYKLRQYLRDQYGFPVKLELHTKPFLLNKNPYRSMDFSPEIRLKLVGDCCDFLSNLDLKFVNVAIVKPKIIKSTYQVLDTALTYSIQRIENDLNPNKNPEERFLIITDSGRVGKMRKTSRRIQRFNYIPSKFNPASYRQEIKSLIEDPLPKDSKESYFIQMCDLVAYVVYLHTLNEKKVGEYSNRLKSFLKPTHVADWMEKLKPSFNLMASEDDPYGVVYHPK